MAIRIECYAGYRGEEEPRVFWLGERRLEVVERWIGGTARTTATFDVWRTTAIATSYVTTKHRGNGTWRRSQRLHVARRVRHPGRLRSRDGMGCGAILARRLEEVLGRLKGDRCKGDLNRRRRRRIGVTIDESAEIECWVPAMGRILDRFHRCYRACGLSFGNAAGGVWCWVNNRNALTLNRKPSWARRINESGRTMFCSPVFPPFEDPSVEIDPRVAPEPGDRIVRKTTTGALASSPLETDLRALGVSSAVVTEVLTPFCVTQTARELADRNFDVAIVDDATTSLTEAAHSAALAAFAAIYGWVVTTRDIVATLDGRLR